jgi:hypothetical protein
MPSEVNLQHLGRRREDRLEDRVIRVETIVEGVEDDVRRIEGDLIRIADQLDQKFTWLIGLVVMILIAIVANGVIQ